MPVADAPVAAAATPRPTEDTAAELAGPICLGAGAWRVATLETWRTQDVRVWRAIEPAAAAAGPLDPAIPVVGVVAVEVAALGWCAPAYGAERPVGPSTVTAWRVGGASAHELPLLQVRPERDTTHLAALYEPGTACPVPTACRPVATGATAPGWTTGRVVFRYSDRGADREWWFAADLEIVGPRPHPGSGTAPAR